MSPDSLYGLGSVDEHDDYEEYTSRFNINEEKVEEKIEQYDKDIKNAIDLIASRVDPISPNADLSLGIKLTGTELALIYHIINRMNEFFDPFTDNEITAVSYLISYQRRVLDDLFVEHPNTGQSKAVTDMIGLNYKLEYIHAKTCMTSTDELIPNSMFIVEEITPKEELDLADCVDMNPALLILLALETLLRDIENPLEVGVKGKIYGHLHDIFKKVSKRIKNSAIYSNAESEKFKRVRENFAASMPLRILINLKLYSDYDNIFV